MNRAIVVVSTLLFIAGSVSAQKMTEMYIPIGHSPGLSGKFTTLGKVTSVNVPAKMVTCTYGADSIEIKVTPRTIIWLDKSGIKQPNQIGTFADCSIGRTIEVKYVNNARSDGGEAEWIKVQISGPQ
ncbi:MAG: hypothetical protein AB1428_06875 [Bacteroidota bacterium]